NRAQRPVARRRSEAASVALPPEDQPALSRRYTDRPRQRGPHHAPDGPATGSARPGETLPRPTRSPRRAPTRPSAPGAHAGADSSPPDEEAARDECGFAST